eukprot:6706015-Prymnesium_polylepis.1
MPHDQRSRSRFQSQDRAETRLSTHTRRRRPSPCRPARLATPAPLQPQVRGGNCPRTRVARGRAGNRL